MTRWLILAVLAVAATAAHGQALVVSSCGTANYTASIGYLHQLTMNPAGYLCVSTTTMLLERAGDGQGAPSVGPKASEPPEPPKPPTPLPEPKK